MNEALSERAEIDKMIAQRRSRIKASARYVEGEEPAEDAAELLTEVRALMHRREVLVRAINERNAATYMGHPDPEIDARMTITEALAYRDRLNAERNLLNEVADYASPGASDYGYGRMRRRSELPEKTDLGIKELRTEADQIARKHREIDGLIQQSNWTTNL
jgi:hypothetical protein